GELLGGGFSRDVGLRADGTRTVLVAVDAPATVNTSAGIGHPNTLAGIGRASTLAGTGLANTSVGTGPEDAADTPATWLGPASVVVATGGGRGVAAAGLHGLAQAYRPRIVLLGRTELRDEPEALRDAVDEASLVHAVVEHGRGEGGRLPTPSEAATTAARILAAREIRANLRLLHQAGSQVRYLPVDVRDTAAVTAALAEIRREWG